MGIEVAALVISAIGTVASISSQDKARQAASGAADEQRKAQSESKAVVAAQQAAERRQQIREERVRRARILQGAENDGSSGSSGEAGAIGSLATQYSTNRGSLAAGNMAAASISTFNQNAANYGFAQQRAQSDASIFAQLPQFVGAIGQAYQGFETYSAGKAAKTSQGNPQMSTSDYLAVRDQ